MNVLGIIAEFNPIHNGHHHLLITAKEQCKADYTIVVMSGNFTQRGEPAIYDKFTRTRLALAAGADLVIEIPVAAATSSARDFARTGVALLAATGVVTHLAFGCENADLPLLLKLSGLLLEEPVPYKKALKDALRQGFSWPAARSRAVMQTLHLLSPDPETNKNILPDDFLKQPNTILALEYLMALKSHEAAGGRTITPLPIQRIHAGYHDTTLDTPVCSATALRRAILGHVDKPAYFAQFPRMLQDDIRQIIDNHTPMTANDFSQSMVYRLLTLSKEELTGFLDMDEDLSRRISGRLNAFTGLESFCDSLTTRAYTRTRISRALLHTLLDIKTTDQSALEALGYAPYLRILGFRRKAAPLLSQIKENAHIPMITRPAAVRMPSSLWKSGKGEHTQSHTSAALRLLSLDIRASHIYRMGCNIKSGIPGTHEFRQKLIIL